MTLYLEKHQTNADETDMKAGSSDENLKIKTTNLPATSCNLQPLQDQIFHLLRLEVRYGSDGERCVGATSDPLTAPAGGGSEKSCQPRELGKARC